VVAQTDGVVTAAVKAGISCYESLAEAAQLSRDGVSFPKIIGMKGWGYNRSGLAKAVKR
jgi:hypothetical protein